MDSSIVKQQARKCGADLVGIAPIERFAELPTHLNPKSIFPQARSVIALGNQIGCGVLRGVMEATNFGAFNLFAHRGLIDVLQPVMLWRFTRTLEDEGFEAVPIANNFQWSNIDRVNPDEMGQDFIDVNPGAYGHIDGDSQNVGSSIRSFPAPPFPRDHASGIWSQPAAPDRPAPDVLLPLRLIGYAAGLGEIGQSGLLLTPEFGPRQRLTAVLTDAELEPDPLFSEKLCDRCGECIRNCPARALTADRPQKLRVAGRELECAGFDFAKCAVGFYGGGENAVNPWIVDEASRRRFNEQPYAKHRSAVTDGMRGCMMACAAHLEKQGKLTRRRQTPFTYVNPLAEADHA